MNKPDAPAAPAPNAVLGAPFRPFRGVVPRRSALSALAGSCLLALAACAGPLPDELEPPQARLVDVGLADAGLLSQVLNLEVAFANPNDAALPVRGLSVRLFADGRLIGQGATRERFRLPRLDETVVSVPVRVETGVLLANLQRALNRRPGARGGGEAAGEGEALTYALEGRLFLPGGPGGSQRVLPFDTETRLEVPGLLP